MSTRMPLASGAVDPSTVVPWIVNLLPEAGQLEAISRMAGIGTQDFLGILSQIGRDTSGALSFVVGGKATADIKYVETDDNLERIISELPAKPFLIGEDGVSMSLAGVQSKIGVYLDENDRIGIPINGAPSTWILKPDTGDRFWGSVYNEAFCLLLAAEAGLDAPEVRIGRADARRYLLVRRYDRVSMKGQWRRVHQEDFCQVLGIFPIAKYESNQTGRRGPGFRDIIPAMRALHLPSVSKLLDAAIFNIIACNTDAHAKNYSVLIRSGGALFAPVYDIMCAAVWPSVTPNLAMSVAGKNRGAYLKGRHWQREAVLCGLNPAATLRQVAAICDRVEAALPTALGRLVALDGEAHAMGALCRGEIEGRITAIRTGLKEADPDPAGWVAARAGGDGT